jgi:plastocyanin
VPARPAGTPNAIASTPATAAGPVAGGPIQIKIVEPPFKPPQQWTFDPVTATVKLGTSITWVNTGAVLHTVTSDDGKAFDSKDITPNATWSFTPTAAGIYHYHCSYHPWMKGTIIVRP